ncbi:MAG: hypothetical protein ABI977_07295 [Acidobacteriota bacterium]
MFSTAASANVSLCRLWPSVNAPAVADAFGLLEARRGDMPVQPKPQ